MALRLRQICLVAPMLEPSVSNICGVLGTVVTYIDPLVGAYGLINALMPFGNSFLEVVAPVEDGTAAGQRSAVGRPIRMMSGSRKLSYCAASTR